MRDSISLVLVGALLGAPFALAGAAAAQEAPSAVCSGSLEQSDPFLAEVARARDLPTPEASKAALLALDPEARRMAADSPDDAAAQYRVAAVLGARLELEKGTDKMSGAEELSDQASRVLELDPNHPGASYMLGRIHASILRLGGFKRFIAGKLFGSRRLKDASWERAQALLETAARGAPCVPEHHFELARLYAHLGDTADAEREVAYVRRLTEGRDGREGRLRQRADELERQLNEGRT